MAGKAKPASAGHEAKYKVISVYGSQGSGGTVENPGLFDGTQINEWNTGRVMYWYANDTTHITLEIKETCNIWRSGTSSWSESNSPLVIEKLNSDGTYTDVTTVYPQKITRITEKQWEKTISGIPKGTYRFKSGAFARLDSEWYLEALYYTLHLLQTTDSLYTIAPDGTLKNLGSVATADKMALFASDGFETLTKTNCETIAAQLGKCKILRAEI